MLFGLFRKIELALEYSRIEIKKSRKKLCRTVTTVRMTRFIVDVRTLTAKTDSRVAALTHAGPGFSTLTASGGYAAFQPVSPITPS